MRVCSSVRFENSLKISRLVFCWEKVKLTTRRNKGYRWKIKVFIVAPNFLLFVCVSIDHSGFGLWKIQVTLRGPWSDNKTFLFLITTHLLLGSGIAVKLAKFLVTLLSLQCRLLDTDGSSEVGEGELRSGAGNQALSAWATACRASIQAELEILSETIPIISKLSFL